MEEEIFINLFTKKRGKIIIKKIIIIIIMKKKFNTIIARHFRKGIFFFQEKYNFLRPYR